jgi:hypothetical protein
MNARGSYDALSFMWLSDSLHDTSGQKVSALRAGVTMNEENWYRVQKLQEISAEQWLVEDRVWLMIRLTEEARRMETMADTVRRYRAALQDAAALLEAPGMLGLVEPWPEVKTIWDEVRCKVRDALK